MTVLITGAAGYIGSHAVLAFREAGRPLVALDNLSTGRREALPDDVTLHVGEVADAALVERVIGEHGVTAVIHFAGSIVVPESLVDPLGYYGNNTCDSRALIETCVRCGVGRFVFSSTAAVYGLPEALPVPESAPVRPISPYGASKLMTEWMLRDTAAAHPLAYVALRYFNVAGADPEGRTGQVLSDSTHLIKVACEVAIGRRPEIQVFGEDYDTPDGTCIRDFIHVSDLAAAHVAALDYLERDGESQVLNCGYGRGFSVRQVLDAVQRVAGRPIAIRAAPRRSGDAPAVVADVERLRRVLDWRPRHDDLDHILETTLAWERAQGG